MGPHAADCGENRLQFPGVKEPIEVLVGNENPVQNPEFEKFKTQQKSVQEGNHLQALRES
jgi:hypothetical protein